MKTDRQSLRTCPSDWVMYMLEKLLYRIVVDSCLNGIDRIEDMKG